MGAYLKVPTLRTPDGKPPHTFAGNALCFGAHFRRRNRYALLLEMLSIPGAFPDAKPIRTFAGNASGKIERLFYPVPN
ncbi:hypothetical protein [Ensifer adhaerens]|uniref:hypothetical protein n=1 Tax=Ensifer adhaerens TaxID=106592 RepID=UPI00131A30B9|nr:hypothetical protein [Ensifer adhaerens]